MIFSQSITWIWETYDWYLSDKTSVEQRKYFLYLNIIYIGSDIHTSVYDKRDDFGFPIVNFSWLSGDVPRLPSTVFTFPSLLNLLGLKYRFRFPF